MRGIAFVIAIALTASVADAKENVDPLTQGMVQLTVRVGQTRQSEILETFGAPNITSMDGGGQEMWVYDRHATVASDSSSGFSIGMLLGGGGGGVGGGAGLGFGKNKSQSQQSTRTMTLIIKFDNNKIVSDFKSRSSSF